MASAPPATSSPRSRAGRVGRSMPSRDPAIRQRRTSPAGSARYGPARRTSCLTTPLDAAIIYAPVGELVPAALRAVRKGGRVVCAGIHMSDIPSFPYNLLWEERQLVSVANLTRQDGLDFLKVAPQAGIQTETTAFPLARGQRSPAKASDGTNPGRSSPQTLGSSAHDNLAADPRCKSASLPF